MSFKQIVLLFILVFAVTNLLQAQFTMQDTTVTECEGTLEDSGAGPFAGQYDHNEDFIFTICVEGAGAVTAIFNFFATEDVFDVLTIYDGPNINSPLITELTGVVTNPPVVVANSGCMTFHFVSDDNIVGTGWLLEWSVEVEDEIDPETEITSDLICPLGSLEFSIDPRVPCDVVTPENFQLVGPDGAGIASATPVNCNANNTASLINLEFTDSLSISGSYSIIYNGYIVNTCNDTLTFETILEFVLSDCPFEVQIVLLEQGCPEGCGQVQVEIFGSDEGPYDINWSHTTENAEIVDICGDSLTSINVQVTNTTTGGSASDNFEYTPFPSPTILNPFLSDTFCSSINNYVYELDIPGGIWNSNIMDNQEDNNYRFHRWDGSNGLQQDFIEYADPNGCLTYDTVYIYPIRAGLDQAVCLEQSELQITGNNPINGTWSGSNTSADGTFTVTMPGTFQVTFTTDEGCTDTKNITVVESIEFTPIDTICSNERIDLRNYVNSLGGIWSGPGITNWFVGRLEAWNAVPNAWNTYHYEIDGCTDSLSIYVSQIWAGPDMTVCSEEDSIQLLFTGQWSGPGTYNPIDSSFDISSLGPGTYEYTRSIAGCEDRFELTILDVRLDLTGSSEYCFNSGMIPIRDLVNSNPYDGTFSGDALVEINGDMYFDPSIANAEETTIYFSTLGCMDSVVIGIEAALNLNDYSFCEIENLQTLDNEGNSGYWTGNGILVPEDGLLNLDELNIGDNEVFFVTNLGCYNSVNIEVIEFLEAEINNLEDSYCFRDSLILFDIAPANGTFLINGTESSPEMNPPDLGAGFHELEYIVGIGACEDRTSTFISILDEISGNTYALLDTLCPNESTSIFVDAFGGTENITATWDQGLGFGTSHTISPNQSTLYTVLLSDGCSDEVSIPLNISVIDTFPVDVIYGPEVCFGDTSFIELVLDDPSNYNITWDGQTSEESHILNGLPGSVFVSLTNEETGCFQEYNLDVPGAGPLGADFNFIPNQECIDIINNELIILNLAFGFTEGYINFGDSDVNIDINSGNLRHNYEDIGFFEITQVVFNELGCTDTLTREICVENRVKLYVPNIFTPNGDDVNDLFSTHGVGIEDFAIQIYDRYGNQVFQTSNINEFWDGRHNGKFVSQGVYAIVVQYKDQETGESFVEYLNVTVSR